MTASLAYQIIQDLWQLNRNFCSSDYDAALEYLKKILPFEMHLFKEPFNGWVIPPKWDLVRATIHYQGKLIFQATGPLQVIGLSQPFQGVVSCDELKRHLHYDRRDMYIARIFLSNGQFNVSKPLRIIHEGKYEKQLCQKNWVPFIWNEQLLLSYSIAPHDVLEPDLMTGVCRSLHETATPTRWKWGQLRGGTPAQIVDGEYLAFFHSSTQMFAESFAGLPGYVMGAYTFSASPPFEITKISACPIQSKEFYAGNRIIFPGGFVVAEPYIYVAYGRGDKEIWIVTLDKNLLKTTLIHSRKPK